MTVEEIAAAIEARVLAKLEQQRADEWGNQFGVTMFLAPAEIEQLTGQKSSRVISACNAIAFYPPVSQGVQLSF